MSRSLPNLSAELEKRGSRLILRRGPTADTLTRLVAETGAAAVFWNRRYEPAAIARDGVVKSKLRDAGLLAESFNGNLLFEPWTIRNQKGDPFRVFSAFWRACQATAVAYPSMETPKRLTPPERWPRSLDIADLKLEPPADRTAGFQDLWHPGELGARRELKRFLKEKLAAYPVNRDFPGQMGTSRLSPHLHFGEISPRKVWQAVIELTNNHAAACSSYLRQIGWREFAYHLLYHFPASPEQPLRPEFSAFPWQNDSDLFNAWKRGLTGYPLVDAGMRELRQTGWMHNRVRMVVGSFLVKHLLIGWREGAAWFWDSLVDADLANNTLGWQWIAGCGADAAPYFRIFNPSVQLAKYDPDGRYIHRWVPELKPGFGSKTAAGYPRPIIDHEQARRDALHAYAKIKEK